MVDGVGGDDSQNVGIHPSPEDNVFWEFNMFEFGLGGQVEDLEDVTSWFIGGFEWDDVVVDVHDGSVDFAAWSSHNIHFVGQFNDADLGGSLSVLVPHAHVFLGLQTGYSELEEVWVDTQVTQVCELSVPEWICLHLKSNI